MSESPEPGQPADTADSATGAGAAEGHHPPSPEVVERFLHYPLFRDLDTSQVSEFLSHCEELVLEPGEVFIDQGEEDNKLFFISEGRLEVFATDESEAVHPLAELSAPAVVGEVEFLTREPRAASVRAATPVYGLVIDGQRLKRELDAGSQVTARVLFYMARVLARRLAAMNRKFVELDQKAPGTRFDELRDFQQRLMSEWTV